MNVIPLGLPQEKSLFYCPFHAHRVRTFQCTVLHECLISYCVQLLSPFFLYLSCFTVPIMFCYYVSSMLFPNPFLPGIACNMAAVSRLCSQHVLKPVNGDILFCLAFPSLLLVIITFGLIKHTAHNSALFACIIMEPEFCLYSCIIMEPSSELERLRSVYPTLR